MYAVYIHFIQDCSTEADGVESLKNLEQTVWRTVYSFSHLFNICMYEFVYLFVNLCIYVYICICVFILILFFYLLITFFS